MHRIDLRRIGGRFTMMMAAVLISAGCSGLEIVVEDETEPSTTTAPDDAETSDGSTELDTDEQGASADVDFGLDIDSLLATLMPGYVKAVDLWPGFAPNDFPTMLVVNDDAGEPVGVIALNYPEPESIGDASELDLAEGIDAAHTIVNLNDGAGNAVGEVESMGFDVDVEAVTTFVVAIDPPGTGGLFDPENPSEFTATLLHEMFHIYQLGQFEEGEGDQDTGGYAYTAENIALALLEDRALVAALEADSPEEQEAAARHVGAIRLVRLDLDPRVVLDEDQEIFEGTARDYESRIAGTDPSFTFRQDNYVDNLQTDTADILGPVKWYFGFERFYSSGAGQLELLRLLGVGGVEERIEAGESPMDILIGELDLTLEEAPALLLEADELYDPTDELEAQGAEAAARAVDEADPLSEDGVAALDSQGSLEDQLRTVFGDEAFQCLEDAGVDFEAEEPPADEILSACGVDLSQLDNEGASGGESGGDAGAGSDGETLSDEAVQCLTDAGYDITGTEQPSAEILAECGLN